MIKFAVVGYGMMGATHLSILKKNPRAHVAALVENDPTKLKSATQGNIGEAPEEDLGKLKINEADVALRALDIARRARQLRD